MKKILLISSLFMSSIINAEYLFTIEPKNYKGYIQQDIKYTNGWSDSGINQHTGTNYDQNGFLQNGQHKDTGTEYDPEGFDIEGYGVEECQPYNRSYQHLRLVDMFDIEKFGIEAEDYITYHWSKNEFLGHFDVGHSELNYLLTNIKELSKRVIGDYFYYTNGVLKYSNTRIHSSVTYYDRHWTLCRKEIKK